MAECQRIDAFELWHWRRLLRVPWTARRSSQSILKEIKPEYSLEGLMMKLKRQYFGHLMRRADSLEKTLMLGKAQGRRKKGWQRMRWLDGVTDSIDINLSKLAEIVENKGAWPAAVHGVVKSQTRFSDWTTIIYIVTYSNSLIFITIKYFIEWMYHQLFLHSVVDEPGLFPVGGYNKLCCYEHCCLCLLVAWVCILGS